LIHIHWFTEPLKLLLDEMSRIDEMKAVIDVCGRAWSTYQQSWTIRISTRKCWNTLHAYRRRTNRSV